MPKRKEPTKSGHWFVTLDDGEAYITDPVLVRVVHHGFNDGAFEGMDVHFAADPEGRHFSLSSVGQEIAMLYAEGVGASGAYSRRLSEYRVTWLSEVLPPQRAPKQGDLLAIRAVA